MTRLIAEPRTFSTEFLAKNDPENWSGWQHQIEMAQAAIDAGYLEVATQRINELERDSRDLTGMPERAEIIEAVVDLRQAVIDMEPYLRPENSIEAAAARVGE